METSRFLRALARQPTDCTPVWFMRQAGRYQREYRELRARYDILTLCRTPELAAQVTLFPVHAFPVDAAILFSDILLPLEPLGISVRFADGEGPILEAPLRDKAQVESLRSFDPREELAFVGQAINGVVRELKGKVPLIGFAAAPFTLASYMIEGGSSRNFERTKRWMLEEPSSWNLLMEKLASLTVSYLRFQVQSGCQAVQLFDTWAGHLSPIFYERFALPYSQKVIRELRATEIPIIHFGTQTGGFLELFAQTEADGIGVDWRISIKEAWRRIGYDRAIQGNLDPAVLLGPAAEIEKSIRWILEEAQGRPGHIFNLGHGILPQTPPRHVALAVELVHQLSPRRCLP